MLLRGCSACPWYVARDMPRSSSYGYVPVREPTARFMVDEALETLASARRIMAAAPSSES